MMLLVRFVLLVSIWLALWSDVSVANVLTGTLVATVVILVSRSWRGGDVVIRPLHATRFAMHFVIQLVKSTVAVSLAVIAPRNRVRPGILAVPLHDCSDAIATLIADTVSLTPGTLTVEVRRDPIVLYVHALDARDSDAVQAAVRRLEVLAVDAFGSPEARARMATGDSIERGRR